MPHACPIGTLDPPLTGLAGALLAFKLRTRRQLLLWRAWRKRGELRALHDRTAQIAHQDVLCFLCVRNEAARLPHFLRHHRALGVRHFLAVDNASTDGSADLLLDQPDVSLWTTGASYKASRFGMDWLTWLMMRHGSGHWCLTLDADELLIYPYWQTRPLPALTDWLDTQGRDSFGALTVDMYPEGPVSEGDVGPGDDPTDHLGWFDAGNYQVQVQPRMRNLWVQGGARARAFFADAPRRAPTLNKTPLVRWHWRYAYVNSTHALLPPRLNQVYATEWGRADLRHPPAHQIPARDHRAFRRREGPRPAFRQRCPICCLLRPPDRQPGVAYAGVHPLHRLATDGGFGPDVAGRLDMTEPHSGPRGRRWA